LQKIEDEAKRVAAERDKISVEFVKNFETMSKTLQIKVNQELTRNEMIILLREGLSKLSKLNSNWAELTINFNSINNYIEEVTHTTLTDFVDNVEVAQENTFPLDLLTDSIEKTLKLSNNTHRAAEMYVDFSHKNIVKSLNDMHQCKNTLLPF
jgi:gamma-glutamylcysteine synthetase